MDPNLCGRHKNQRFLLHSFVDQPGLGLGLVTMAWDDCAMVTNPTTPQINTYGYGFSLPPLQGHPKGIPVAGEGSLVESEYRKGPGGALDRAVLRGVVNSF